MNAAQRSYDVWVTGAPREQCERFSTALAERSNMRTHVAEIDWDALRKPRENDERAVDAVLLCVPVPLQTATDVATLGVLVAGCTVPVVVVAEVVGEAARQALCLGGVADVLDTAAATTHDELADVLERALAEWSQHKPIDVAQARLTATLTARVVQQRAVAEFGHFALSHFSLAETLDESVRVVSQVLGVELATVMELEPQGTQLFMRAGTGWRAGTLGRPVVQAQASQAGYTLRREAPVIVEDLRTETRFRPSPLLREHGIVSGISCIIRSPEPARPYGVLGAHTQLKRRFTHDDVNFLQAVGNIVADAVLREQVAQQHQDSEARLRAVIDAAVDGIVVFDEAGSVEMVNPAAERIFGLERGTMVGMRIGECVPELEPHRDPENGGLALGDVGEVIAHKHGDGDFPLEFAVSEATLGTRRVYVCIVRDISERKRAERAIHALNEALATQATEHERTAQRLSELTKQLTEAESRERRRVAYMLHDYFQQILVAAKMANEGVRRDATGKLDERVAAVEKLLDEAISASRDLAVDLFPPVLYDAGLVAALKWLATRMKEQHALEVELEACNGEPGSEELRAFLFQAAGELLLNVVKHGGTSRAWLRFFADDQSFVLEVIDRGVGCDPCSLTELAMKSDVFGLLSIQQRTKLLDGRFEVRSAPGEGFHARLSVPRQSPEMTPRPEPIATSDLEEPALEEDSLPSTRLAPIRVVLVDDHAILRHALAAALDEIEEIELVGEAGDGMDAIEQAKKLHPDVVVMDVSMPRMDGIEATRRIREQLPGIAVVGLSMHEDDGVRRRMLGAGARAYIPKGGPPEALVSAIRRAARTPCASTSSAEGVPRET